jgi:hypothetical protein
MPPTGPELPPHLAKRKRSIDDAEPPSSPPHKMHAAAPARVSGPVLPSKNPDEVDIEDSSEDDYGPSIQPGNSSRKPSPPKQVLGPTPPSKNPDELDVDASSEDDYGPTPQPNTSKPTAPKRILGPSLPPAPLFTMPSHPPTDTPSSSDDDDDYAPALPPPPGSLAAQALQQQQQTLPSLPSPSAAKPRRAEWMLVPPTPDASARTDPTQLKSRKFASSRGAAPADKSSSAIWTETPEEKRRRLADEVLGRVDPAAASSRAAPKVDKTDAETERRIREYNERNRGRSLYEAHKQAPKEEEDDPSARGFDREKDMALGGRLGHGQKREMLAKAADFGSRFQKGRYL